jgi:predicted RNA-binding protein with PIN domain
MPFIIDGYNLLHFIQEASEGFGAITDVQLCRVISGYLKLIDEKGEVIFDGTGPRDKGAFDNISNLEVFFTGLRSDADTVIEDKIKASTAPRRLTIVSSDRRLRDAAKKRRATVVKSQVFWDNVQKRLSRKTKVKEPLAKREGLSEGETEQWLKIFDL